MKRGFLIAAVVLCLSADAYAQGPAVAVRTVTALSSTCRANSQYTEIVELRSGVAANDGFYRCKNDGSGWQGPFADAASAAPSNATYITQTPNATLTNEQAMSTLATGLVKNTTTTGVQSIVVPGTGVEGALQVNVGSAGAPVLFNGAGGTPSSITLTNGTGLPTTGLTGTLQAAQEPAHTGDVTNSAGSLALSIAANAVTLAKLATQATNTVLGNATSGTAVPTALAVGSCSTSGSALIWTTNTGFGCNTSIAANTATTATDTASKTGTGSTYVTNTSPTVVTPTFTTSTNTNVAADGDIKTDGNRVTRATTTWTQINSFGGASNIIAGFNGSHGIMRFYTSDNTTTTERARIHASGCFSINNTTDCGAGNLSVSGSLTLNANLILRQSAAGNLTLGDVAANPPVAQTISVQNASGTDIAGATTTEIASLQTGQAVPGRYHIQTGAVSPSSASTLATAIDRFIVGATKVLTNNSAITIVNVTDASNTTASVQLHYGIEVFNGTDLQHEDGLVTCHISNKAGTIANNVCLKSGNQQLATSGTLTVTFAISAANPGLLSVNANSSLTPSAGYPRITYTLFNGGQQAVAIQ